MSTINLDVVWRDRGAARGLKQLSDQAERAERGMQRFRTVGALAGVAVGAAIGKFAVDSVKAYGEAQTAQAKLEFAFRRFPKLADTNIQALRGLNTELARKTKFDDDATASGQAVLAQFNLTGQQIQRLTPLLQDYAAKTGKDLPTAARDLGKATLGQGRALKAVGINFKDTGDRAGNFEQIMGGLRKQVGGFAEAEGKTAAGQLAILKNQFGELQEAAGAHLVPALTQVVGATTKAVVAFGELGPGMKAGITTLAVGLPTIALAAAGIGKLRTVALETSAAFKAMGISAKGATIATAGIGAALGVAALAVGAWAQKHAESKAAVQDMVGVLRGETGAIVENSRAWAAKRLSEQRALEDANTLGISLEDVTSAALGNADALRRVMAATDANNAVSLEQADTMSRVRAAVGATNKEYGKAQTESKNLQAATGGVSDAMGGTTNKTKSAAEALREWRTQALKAGSAALALEGSEDAVEAAIDNVTKSVKQNGHSLDNNTEKGRNNRQALRDLASASQAHINKLIEQNKSTKTVNRATDNAREAFIKAATKITHNRKEAEKLAEKYGFLDRKINDLNDKKVDIKFATNAKGVYKTFKGYAVNLSSPSRVGGLAAGGPVRGPGSSTSDSVMGIDRATGRHTAWVSRDEYVVNAKSARKYRPLIEDINANRLAGGGYVNVAARKFPQEQMDVPKGANQFSTAYAKAGGKAFGEGFSKIFKNAFESVTNKMQASVLPGGGSPTGRGMGGVFRYARGLGMGHSTYRGHGERGMGKSWDFSPVGGGRGNKLAGHAWAHAKHYGIWYIIWNRRIASRTRPGAGWRPYTRYGNTSNPNKAHTNHVHISWYDKGGMLKPGGLGMNASGQPERVLSPAQTKSFDRLVKVMDRSGGGVTVVQNISLPNYVGSHSDIVNALVKLKRQGRLDVALR